jgi:hypothetical protein
MRADLLDPRRLDDCVFRLIILERRSLRAKIREARGGKAKTVTPKVKTPTPKKAVNMYINKFVNKLDKDEVNALKKKICQP